MATVGYGDYFPLTLPGRIIIFVTAIWAAIIISLMVVALTNTLESIYFIIIIKLKWIYWKAKLIMLLNDFKSVKPYNKNLHGL